MILRRIGIRQRLILSFLLVLVAPVAVSVATLAVALAVFVPRAEAAYVGRIQRSLEAEYLPGVIAKLRLGEVQALLEEGRSDEVTAIVENVWPLISEAGGRAEIVRGDGTVLFTIGGSGLRFGRLEPPAEIMLGALDPGQDGPAALLGRLRIGIIPGLSFVDTSTARYVWPLAPDAGGAVYGRFTFTVPGSARAVQTVSGSYTLVAVGAGVLAFAALVVVLSLRLSRLILVPLRRLSAAAQHIAEGNLDEPVGVDRADEFGRLAAAFEQMRVRLRGSLLGLQRADVERRQMIASVSHDLKTPLTSIRGYVEGLRDGVADNPETRDRYYAVALEKAAQLETLIDGLSRIARLELGDEPLSRRPESSRRLFAGLFDRARRDAEAAGLSGTVAGPLPDAPLSVDAAAIAQVVDNIVQNALRHASGARSLRLSAVARGGMLEVTIADDGPGFVPADLPRVFDLFYRGDAARASRTGGAGLGLAICRRIVEQHGGTIVARNDGGAVVAFTLPLEVRA